jgi:hypothetical protein
MVEGQGGFSAVNNTGGLKDHFSEMQGKVAQKNGYVYIYVSNESPVNVFFDNLQVVHSEVANKLLRSYKLRRAFEECLKEGTLRIKEKCYQIQVNGS